MSRQKVFEVAVVAVLLSMGSFVIMGFTAEKQSCTEDQIEYCVEQVKENMETCVDDESCNADLLGWFEGSCMAEAIHCDQERIESVMDELGWEIG